MKKKVNSNLTSFEDHLDQQYGKRGTSNREKFEEGNKQLVYLDEKGKDIREFNFKGRCCKGDVVHIFIEITKSFSGFSIINGHLTCSGKEVAAGTLKLWVPDEGAIH